MATEQPIIKFANGQTAAALAFGTWQIPKEDAELAVYTALKIGYRHLDFAQIYGNNVECGKGVKKAIEEGIVKREDIWITSKIWNDDHKNVTAAVDRLLDELQLDYLNLILIHWPISFVKGANPMDFHKDLDLSVVYAELEEAVKAGKTKNIGISNFSIEETKNILDKCTIKPICNQVESSIYWKQLELEEFLNANGMVLVSYSPLCQNQPPKQLNIEFKNLFEDQTLIAIAKKHNTTPAAVALRWHLDFNKRSDGTANRCVLAKSNKPNRVVENFETVTALKLDEDDLKAIAAIDISFRSLNPWNWRKDDKPFFPNY